MRIQPRKRFLVAMPTPLAWRKAASGRPIARGRAGVAGVPRPGHASKGTSREPRRAPLLLPRNGCGAPNRKAPGCARNRGPSWRGANKPAAEEVPAHQGRPEVPGKGEEQSYESMVPKKVGNRRAPARGGHGTHWRDGTNKHMSRSGGSMDRTQNLRNP